MISGIKESDTGLSKPSQWDLIADKEILEKESVLQVRRGPQSLASSLRLLSGRNEYEFASCLRTGGALHQDHQCWSGGCHLHDQLEAGVCRCMAVYFGQPALSATLLSCSPCCPQVAKFVVGLDEKVAPTDIEEGMRVGVDRVKYSIKLPLPPKIDPTVTMMTVEEKVRGFTTNLCCCLSFASWCCTPLACVSPMPCAIGSILFDLGLAAGCDVR